MLDERINAVISEVNRMNSENSEAINGVTSGLSEQIQTLASQMGRDKEVIYNADGDPIGIRTVTE